MKLLLGIVLTILAYNLCDGARILALFPLNGKSHWVMGEQLLTNLAERGHQLDVVTHFPLKKPPANYREISLDGTIEQVVNNMNASVLEKIGNQNLGHMVELAGNKCCKLLEHEKLQNLIKNSQGQKYDVIIVELFVAPCFLAFGRHLNVPMVGVMTSSFHDWVSAETGYPHNPSYMPNVWSQFNQRMSFWERLTNTFVTNTITLQMKYHLSRQSEFVKKAFGMDTTIAELYQGLAAILVNSHHSLNGVNPTPPGIIEVGGLHVKDTTDPLPTEVQKWLDESTHGCIYVSFGSMMRIETFPKPMLQTFYKVFEKIAPVRVLMKIAKKEELMPGLPKNVMTQSWFPQVAVFKHKNIKAFITHGGLMGTQEAIYFGVPMIGIPLFGDQPTNLKNAADKNIVVNLGSTSNVTEETLTYAVNTILHDETYRNSMKRLSQLFKDRPMSAMDTAIYWIEYVARNGFILQSPSIYLTWWQRNLLDVYGFVFAGVAIVLYLCFFLLRTLKNRLFGCKSCPVKSSKPADSKKKR